MRFLPLKSIITYCMTFITAWLAPDCWYEQFLFNNLSQNINILKDIFQILCTLLGPLFKEPAPSAWYQKKGPVILYISCSTTVQKFLTVLKISVHVSCRGRTCNSQKGPHRTKWEVFIVQNFILNNFCSITLRKIFAVFKILEVKDLLFWPLKSLIT